MNLLFSYGVNADLEFKRAGHLFLGAAADLHGSEVHVWIKKDCGFPDEDRKRIWKVATEDRGT